MGSLGLAGAGGDLSGQKSWALEQGFEMARLTQVVWASVLEATPGRRGQRTENGQLGGWVLVAFCLDLLFLPPLADSWPPNQFQLRPLSTGPAWRPALCSRCPGLPPSGS